MRHGRLFHRDDFQDRGFQVRTKAACHSLPARPVGEPSYRASFLGNWTLCMGSKGPHTESVTALTSSCDQHRHQGRGYENNARPWAKWPGVTFITKLCEEHYC